jgi:hypothetical protein
VSTHGRIPVRSYSGEFPCRQFALFHGRIPVASLSGELPWRPLFGRTRYSGVKHFGRSRYSGGEQFGGDPIFLLGCGSGNGNGNGGGGGEGGSRWRRPVPRLPLPPEDLLQRHREGHLLPQGQGTSCSGTEKAIFDLKDIAEEYGVLQAKVL